MEKAAENQARLGSLISVAGNPLIVGVKAELTIYGKVCILIRTGDRIGISKKVLFERIDVIYSYLQPKQSWDNTKKTLLSSQFQYILWFQQMLKYGI